MQRGPGSGLTRARPPSVLVQSPESKASSDCSATRQLPLNADPLGGFIVAFDTEQLLADLQAAGAEASPERAVREVVNRAVSQPNALLSALGEPKHGGIERIHVAQNLTVLNVVWAPRMTLKPHNHNMWAVIGVYTGREDNIFWRRLDAVAPGIEAAGAKSLGAGEAQPLGRDIIHSVTNPTASFTGAIHVYGGDFFEIPRSEWEPSTLQESPYDVEGNLRLFEEANAAVVAT